LQSQINLYSSSILLLRCFSGGVLRSLKLVYDFNLKKSDIIVELNDISNFWTFFIVLKNSLLFNYIQLNDITCTDNLNILSRTDVTKTKNRFSLIYIFSNIKFASQLIVKVTINFNQVIPSLFNLFSCASWLEREIFDLFVSYSRIIPIYAGF
jgi:NADH:ubiquinone oxidoreductase subunit C